MESELPLNDERRAPDFGSRAWRRQEWQRYRDALWKREGLFPVHMAAFYLGVSRQRVHQLFDTGVLERLEFFGHVFAPGDELDVLKDMEDERRRPGFRLSEKAA